ncbi:MAG: Mechanosensitive ion channel-domain-containing protein [Linnemannia gamsii]|nr:MAG: Mechanosensitive ion channel-domain-containing protein [Linnemannia gamsii]
MTSGHRNDEGPHAHNPRFPSQLPVEEMQVNQQVLLNNYLSSQQQQRQPGYIYPSQNTTSIQPQQQQQLHPFPFDNNNNGQQVPPPHFTATSYFNPGVHRRSDATAVDGMGSCGAGGVYTSSSCDKRPIDGFAPETLQEIEKILHKQQQQQYLLHQHNHNANSDVNEDEDEDDIDEKGECADFHPPRQAMNSDESDFDWYEDINIDGDNTNNKGSKKASSQTRSNWKRLAPFVRMLLLIIIIAPLLALPAVLAEIFIHVDDDHAADPEVERQHELRRILKHALAVTFTWLAVMWIIVCINNWIVDIIPAVVVQITSWVAPTKVETLKSRLLIYVGTKRYIKWVLATIWALGVFLVLSHWIHPTIADMGWHHTVDKVLGGLIAGALLILLEKALLNKISEGFHRTAYADRIKDNKYALSVVDRLGTSRKNIKRPKPGTGGGVGGAHSSLSGGRVTPVPFENVEIVGGSSGHLLTPGSGVSEPPQSWLPHSQVWTKSWDPPRFMSKGRRASKGDLVDADTITIGGPPFEKPCSQATISTTTTGAKRTQRERIKELNRKLHSLAMADNTPTKDINSTEYAKRTARTLFNNLQGTNEELVVNDFYPYFDTQKEAKAAFAMFDKDGNGDISKREMKEKIFYIYKERKDLHTALRDLSQAVGKLDMIFLSVAFVIWLIIILSIFVASVVQNMLSIGSFLVALRFVFGNSLRTLFENIVFLFITHPYDSGDLCDIDGTFMYVREVGLNSTMFVTWDGRRIYFPNHVLSQKAINNIRRSPNMTDKIVVHIDVYTPQEAIFELRSRMREFLEKESKEFSPGMEIQIQEIDVRLKISMCIEHNGNWQDSSRRWARRTKFHYALRAAIEDIGIKYYSIPERVELVRSSGDFTCNSSTVHSPTSPRSLKQASTRSNNNGTGGGNNNINNNIINNSSSKDNNSVTMNDTNNEDTLRGTEASATMRSFVNEQQAAHQATRRYRSTRRPQGGNGGD